MNRNYMRTIPKEWRTTAKVFAALGDEHRQRILLTFEPGGRWRTGQKTRAIPSHIMKLRCGLALRSFRRATHSL